MSVAQSPTLLQWQWQIEFEQFAGPDYDEGPPRTETYLIEVRHKTRHEISMGLSGDDPTADYPFVGVVNSRFLVHVKVCESGYLETTHGPKPFWAAKHVRTSEVEDALSDKQLFQILVFWYWRDCEGLWGEDASQSS